MQTNTTGSNVLSFPNRNHRRFGRPRYSSLYLLGTRLFNRAISVPIVATITRLVVGVRTHHAGRRLNNSSRALLCALDDLIVLKAGAYHGNLDLLLREIEARRRHWQVAMTDIHR